jgi:ABC-type transport system involved in cytochrome c biogenesis permease subunit
MKKVVLAVLIFTTMIFLINPLSSDARGGYWGWWAPCVTDRCYRAIP